MIRRWLSSLLFWALTWALTVAGSQARAGAGFCGSIDFPKTPNSALFDLVALQDLAEKRSQPRSQCGLGKETLAICSACTNEFPEDSLSLLRPVIGSKEHLDWHAKWHKIRSGHASIDEALFKKLQKAGLVPSDFQRSEFYENYGIQGRLAGENFFFMHRMMIKMVQFELAMQGRPCIAPWAELPALDDATWPIPRSYTNASEKAADQAKLESYRAQLARYRDSEYLKTISLNQLGVVLEATLHQRLHDFYQGTPRCSPEAKAQGFCDDLVPVETSPLNKHFWKIHGLVDEILVAWLDAHGYSEISTTCDGRVACFEWKATWVGKTP